MFGAARFIVESDGGSVGAEMRIVVIVESVGEFGCVGEGGFIAGVVGYGFEIKEVEVGEFHFLCEAVFIKEGAANNKIRVRLLFVGGVFFEPIADGLKVVCGYG